MFIFELMITEPDKSKSNAEMNVPKMQIPFCRTTSIGAESEFSSEFANYQQKEYSALSRTFLKNHFKGSKVFLTKSCSEALELAAIAANLSPGDEVILPSFGF